MRARGTPARGTRRPGTPARGTRAPGTTAPGTRRPGTRAPGTRTTGRDARTARPDGPAALRSSRAVRHLRDPHRGAAERLGPQLRRDDPGAVRGLDDRRALP